MVTQDNTCPVTNDRMSPELAKEETALHFSCFFFFNALELKSQQTLSFYHIYS